MEILAAADFNDRGFDINHSLESIFVGNQFRHELLVDSWALFDTITTRYEPCEYRLGNVVSGMRDAFESCYLILVKWVQVCKFRQTC